MLIVPISRLLVAFIATIIFFVLIKLVYKSNRDYSKIGGKFSEKTKNINSTADGDTFLLVLGILLFPFGYFLKLIKKIIERGFQQFYKIKKILEPKNNFVWTEIIFFSTVVALVYLLTCLVL